VRKAGKHVEVSTLMITEISDNEQTARKVANWVLTELDPNVPVHFVRFHPDYKMTDTVRTPIPRLVRAREVALDMGLEHVYVGNVYDTPYSNTYCRGCGAELVNRYGLNARAVGLDEQGHCRSCGRDAHFKLMPLAEPAPNVKDVPVNGMTVKTLDWHGDIRSAHVRVCNTGKTTSHIYHRRRFIGEGPEGWKTLELMPGENYRFIMAKSRVDEIGFEIHMPAEITSNLHEVFDRAHFPTLAIEEVGVATRDVTPLPIFHGNKHNIKSERLTNE